MNFTSAVSLVILSLFDINLAIVERSTHEYGIVVVECVVAPGATFLIIFIGLLTISTGFPALSIDNTCK